MGKAAGFALILAGVGTAAYVVPSLDTRDRAAERRASDVAAITVAAPSSTLPSGSALAPREITTVEKVVKPTAAIETASTPAKPFEPIKIVAPPAPQRNDQRLALTKDIQRELNRVGCYTGNIDGEWNAQTRQAMKTFVDRVNATLPIDAPDHILKTLVSGHPGDACGKSCPAGQTASNGRCLPTQIQAQAPRGKLDGTRTSNEVPRVARKIERQPEQQEVAAVPVPVPVPKPRDKPAAPAVVSSWAPTAVTAPIPPVAAPQPRPAPVMAAAPPVAAEGAARADLSGRMSVGAGVSADVATAKPLTADSTPAIVAPAPKEAARIVIKKREGAVAKAAPVPVAPKLPVDAEGQAKATAPMPPRQQTAAIKPSEPVDATAVTVVPPRKPAAAKPRIVSALPPPVRIAPPRFVGVYVSPPVYRERFGPSIFRKMEREAR